MRMRRRHRLVAAALVTLMIGGAGAARAATPPRGRWATLYLRAAGCGETKQPGRLEARSGRDTSTGCGSVGDAAVGEAVSELSPRLGVARDDGAEFRTGKAGVRVRLRSGRIAGQLAARTALPAGGGAGTLRFDVLLVARADSGRYLPFERTSVSVAIQPGQELVRVPFAIDVRQNAGAVMTQVQLFVYRRGAGVGMDAEQYDGESWISFPRG